MKRCIDIVVALTSLLILMLPLIILMGFVRCKLGKPVFFKQERPGLHGRAFLMVKFRSMADVRGEDGVLLSDACRLTPFGKFLRSTSLDELPELWNVLKGDMSLVGPRPLASSYLPLYSATQFRRHEVRPGITGWAQVNGRNAISWAKKFELDVWYVDNQTLWLDLKIMCITVIKVLKRDDVKSDGQSNVVSFDGNN